MILSLIQEDIYPDVVYTELFTVSGLFFRVRLPRFSLAFSYSQVFPILLYAWFAKGNSIPVRDFAL